MEKFIKEGGAKVETKKAKVDQAAAPSKAVQQETPARAGGYDEQQVSNLKAVRMIYHYSMYKHLFFIRKMHVVLQNQRVLHHITI